MSTELYFPIGSKPSKAVSSDPGRPVLQTGHIRKNGEGWVLEATDSYKAIQLPVTVGGDQPEDEARLTIPAPALKAGETKSGGLSFNGNGVLTPVGPKAPAHVLFRMPEPVITAGEEVKPPGVGKLLDKRRAELKKSKTAHRIGLNAKFLAELAAALGTEAVAITVDPEAPLRPILVEPTSGREGQGLLMPIRLDS